MHSLHFFFFPVSLQGAPVVKKRRNTRTTILVFKCLYTWVFKPIFFFFFSWPVDDLLACNSSFWFQRNQSILLISVILTEVKEVPFLFFFFSFDFLSAILSETLRHSEISRLLLFLFSLFLLFLRSSYSSFLQFLLPLSRVIMIFYSMYLHMCE